MGGARGGRARDHLPFLKETADTPRSWLAMRSYLQAGEMRPLGVRFGWP